MSNIAKIVGERLRNYRMQLGYSQETLAEKAGLHPTYIGQLERGEKNATLETIEKVAFALEVPLEKLFEKIVLGEHTQTTAEKCYNMIQSKSQKQQKMLYDILQMVLQYQSDQ